MTLGESSDAGEEDVQGVNVSDGSEETPGSSTVGTSGKKRKTGATGTPSKAINDYFLSAHIGNMAEHVGKISDTIAQRATAALREEAVVSIVKEEIRESLLPTKKLLTKIHSMLENLSSSQMLQEDA